MISSANNTHFLQECLSATARVGRVTNLNLGRRCLHRLMPLFRSRFYGIVGKSTKSFSICSSVLFLVSGSLKQMKMKPSTQIAA